MAVIKTEERLREEQKVVRHQKKIAKVQELLSSEEEMKKRKHRLVSYDQFQTTLVDHHHKVRV